MPARHRRRAGRASSHGPGQFHGLFDQPLRLPPAIIPGNREKQDQERQQRHLNLREAHRHEPQPFRKLARAVSASIAHAAMTIGTSSLSDSEIRSLAARLGRPVVLVGMMGVGKSTIGRKLAQLFHLPFADADDEIEKAAQMSVSEIFERFGEEYFRDGERRVIARLLDSGPMVVATGGGAFAQAATRALILERGIAVWLDSDVATLVDRVSRNDNRPLLRAGDPVEIITRLKAERESAYAEATIKVMSNSGPHSETVNRILQELAAWL